MITEALIEMHYHRSLVDLFSQTFGKNFLRILKPSPQNERWVGFDQGWVHTDIKINEFFDDLKDKLGKSETSYDKLYLAYFFQFKAVEEITRSSNLKPSTYNTPYFRSELSLTPNKTTNVSQHETLQRLSKISKTEVSYACGMLFDLFDIYDTPVDLSTLRLVPVTTAPTGWATNQRHFITFQTKTDNNPLWCSKPKEGESYSANEILERQRMKLLSATELLELLSEVDKVLMKNIDKSERYKKYYPESFTIIEFQNNG